MRAPSPAAGNGCSSRTGFLRGAGERQIYWRSWHHRARPRAVVVIVHGAGEHGGRYGHVARRLLEDGYAVYAPDHRGHGRSEGPRALIDRLDNAVADLDQVVVAAGQEHPHSPVIMLGHSMGATIALRYTIRHQPKLEGLILSGALAALDGAPAPMRWAGRLLSALAPTLPLISIDAALVSRDPAVVDAYRSDPLVHHGRLPARTVAELAAAIEAFSSTVGAIRLPTLILYGTADRLCPTSGSTMLYARIGATDRQIRAYEGLYHEIFNEPERDKVLADVCTWLRDRVPAGASVQAAGSSTL